MNLISKLGLILVLYTLRDSVMKDICENFIKVEVFIPSDSKEKLIDALADSGILKYENYDRVYSQTKVLDHFIPLENANPFIGEKKEECEVEEVKLEFRIKAKDKEKVFKIIKENHPYEVAVINFIGLL